MISATKGLCSECTKEGDIREKWIVNKTHKLCNYHNQIRLHGTPYANKQTPIKQKRYSETFQYCTKWGFSKEMEMFLYIWNHEPHVSFFTGQPIRYFHPGNFLHVLAKGLNQFPNYRLNPNNIVLGTLKEHHLADMGTDDERKAYQKVFPNYSYVEFLQLQEKLKQQYYLEFPSVAH